VHLADVGTDVQFLKYDDIALTQVVPSPHQPRKHMDTLVIESLMESIQAVGVLQRPRVREIGEGFFELVFGHQRAEACKRLGYEALPVEVIACSDLTARRMTLHENIKSTRLHPIEHAESICKFLDATLSNDECYMEIEGETAVDRIFRVLTLLIKPLAEGEMSSPARDWVLTKTDHIYQVVREMANKEPKNFLSSDVSLLTLPDEIIQTTVERGLKKGHAKVLGELRQRQPEMYEQVMAHGVPGADGEDIPLEKAGVGAIRGLYKEKKKPKAVESDPSEMAAYQSYIPVGVPSAPIEESVPEATETMPWEDGDDDEAIAPMFALPLATLAEAHSNLTTLSAEEWASMINESSEPGRGEAKRQWMAIQRWAEEVNRALAGS
jgi:ParB/RepB/Spo0J family partition protein